MDLKLVVRQLVDTYPNVIQDENNREIEMERISVFKIISAWICNINYFLFQQLSPVSELRRKFQREMGEQKNDTTQSA